jgi:hypothetical protein
MLDQCALTQFFSDWRELHVASTLVSRLERFLRELKLTLPDRPLKCASAATAPNLDQLQRLFLELPEALALSRRSGALCDPWAAAGLRRDEVRNSAVLAWWLDPRANHGLDNGLLKLLLSHLQQAGILSHAVGDGERAHVRVESCPDGDQGNRVDIEIDDENFLLIIEVKIDAPEGERQLSRYCQVAEHRTADGRPWGIVFLTPTGRRSTTIAAERIGKVVPLSWKAIASFLDQAASQWRAESSLATGELPAFLARRFSEHIRNF